MGMPLPAERGSNVMKHETEHNTGNELKHEIKDMDFQQSFDIDDVSFSNVNREFEDKFRTTYRDSLSLMSDSKDRIRNASGANTLGILEKMARRMETYDKGSDFEESYYRLEKEFEPFTET